MLVESGGLFVMTLAAFFGSNIGFLGFGHLLNAGGNVSFLDAALCAVFWFVGDYIQQGLVNAVGFMEHLTKFLSLIALGTISIIGVFFRSKKF